MMISATSLILRPYRHALPGFNLGHLLGMPEITFPVPSLHFADAKAAQMLAKRLADQRGTTHVSPSGSLVDGAQQLGIEYDLNGLHTWSLLQE